MTFFPSADDTWEHITARDAGFDESRLATAIAFAESHGSPWPKDIDKAGNVPGLSQFEKAPWNEALGEFIPRGETNGLILKGGRIAAQWGETGRVEMTFSIAKSYLSILAGLAISDGLIGSVDDPVAKTVPGELFASDHNSKITWRHLLTQTSEWEGTLWDKPDLVDRNRKVGPGSNNDLKGTHRDLQAPGTFWEYNDVRVNVLSLALLHVFRRPLGEVLKERVMDPIGASETWRWVGYRNSFVEIDGIRMQSVPGGTHWGGGLQINSLDHARFALLVRNDGVWDAKRIVPEGWVNQLHTPSPVNAGYGFLWWLNTGQEEWAGVPETSYGAVGAGSHIIWIDPDHDLVIVARWVNQIHVEGLIQEFAQALI
ncbi:MAG: serine hydrolase [Rhodospirillales bacterium]|jgi:CubicO group peptidase (beta-lactamase class C family)|nr:serine hydrolase [Rhodospirillales bacterium]